MCLYSEIAKLLSRIFNGLFTSLYLYTLTNWNKYSGGNVLFRQFIAPTILKVYTNPITNPNPSTKPNKLIIEAMQLS